MSDAVITRSFPIASLIKDKKIASHYKPAVTALNSDNSEMASLHDGKHNRADIQSLPFTFIAIFPSSFDEYLIYSLFVPSV
jgi:hypothetical protein